MSELKEAKHAELDRCLNALYLECPKPVADDVNRIVREAIEAASSRGEEEAQVLRKVVNAAIKWRYSTHASLPESVRLAKFIDEYIDAYGPDVEAPKLSAPVDGELAELTKTND